MQKDLTKVDRISTYILNSGSVRTRRVQKARCPRAMGKRDVSNVAVRNVGNPPDESWIYSLEGNAVVVVLATDCG